MNEELIRKLPFSLIAEQSLLGAILIDPDCFNEIAGSVSADDFYLTEHTQIFKAMHTLYQNSKEIDIVTLIDMLVSQGIYSKSGGEDYIRTLGQSVANSLNVKDYAKIIRDKSLLRTLINTCGDISDIAMSEEGEAGDIINLAESRIFDIAQGKDTRNFRHIRDVIGDVYVNLNKLAAEGVDAQGTKTGFSGLDGVLAGMGNTDFIIVGARPGMGKTSFVLNIATNVALRTKKKVCVFSLEMSAEQLVTRIISSEAMVDSYLLRTGALEAKHWDAIAETSSKLAECDILIDDTSNITVTGMKAKLRRVDDLGLVVVDYLGLMQSDKKTDNRVQEVGDISRNLKLMAKELGVPIICCAQLSRDNEKRSSGNKRPVLSDLRDSGNIEQDADIVIFLYRDEYYDLENQNNEGSIAEIIVAKNRHGAQGTVKMGWIKQYTKFRTIANMEEPQ